VTEPYRIRLRGPWKYEWLEPKDRPEGSGTVQMPARWEELFGKRAGRVRFQRRFGRPTNLEPSERVFVVFEGVGGNATVWLNGQPLGQLKGPRGAFDVTELLRPSNQLVVEVEYAPDRWPDTPGGLWGLVLIEIRQSSDHRSAPSPK